jgi:HTH-type transcriptional regulator / antitoxin MqsA
MKCVSCGSAELVNDARDVPYTYKGETTILPAATGLFCPNCNESIFDKEESIRLNSLMLEFNKQVNRASIQPEYIAMVRKKLNLDQRQAAEIFGGGVNAFSRYENGKNRPPLSTVTLLKMLDRKPELLEMIREIQESNLA